MAIEKIMGPQRYLYPNLKPCECVTLHSKKDFENIIKLNCLKWGDYNELSGWVQCNQKDS